MPERPRTAKELELVALARSDVGAGEFGAGPVGPQRHVQPYEDVKGLLQARRRELLSALLTL